MVWRSVDGVFTKGVDWVEMSKNIAFGQRVRRARETLGASRADVARLAGIDLNRYKMFEFGQLDQSDLSDEQKRRLPEVLRVSADLLILGEEASSLAGGTIAQRSSGGAVQAQMGFAAGSCSYCHNGPVQGSRCENCGHGDE
jgi:hypothetical protein